MEKTENLMFFNGIFIIIRPLAFQFPVTFSYVVSLRPVSRSVMVDETISLVR